MPTRDAWNDASARANGTGSLRSPGVEPSDDARDRAADTAMLGARARSGTSLAAADRDRLQHEVAADPDPAVRAAALTALVRAGTADVAWPAAAVDDDAGVRRRAAELAPAAGDAVPLDALVAMLADENAWVAEASAFALGERTDATAALVDALAAAATTHADALVREAAVAALGAIGDPAGLEAVLHGCDDKPAIRRRAVLALAAFTGPDVEAALRRALDDNDWQVRQNAEDLLN
jgi:HEAT repeat protein